MGESPAVAGAAVVLLVTGHEKAANVTAPWTVLQATQVEALATEMRCAMVEAVILGLLRDAAMVPAAMVLAAMVLAAMVLAAMVLAAMVLAAMVLAAMAANGTARLMGPVIVAVIAAMLVVLSSARVLATTFRQGAMVVATAAMDQTTRSVHAAERAVTIVRRRLQRTTTGGKRAVAVVVAAEGAVAGIVMGMVAGVGVGAEARAGVARRSPPSHAVERGAPPETLAALLVVALVDKKVFFGFSPLPLPLPLLAQVCPPVGTPPLSCLLSEAEMITLLCASCHHHVACFVVRRGLFFFLCGAG